MPNGKTHPHAMTVLRCEITPRDGQKGISEIIVGIGDPSKCCLQPKYGQK